MQLEWLTGGECKAGMHEVAVSEATLQAVERARREGRSLWRVSSTVGLVFLVLRLGGRRQLDEIGGALACRLPQLEGCGGERSRSFGVKLA